MTVCTVFQDGRKIGVVDASNAVAAVKAALAAAGIEAPEGLQQITSMSAIGDSYKNYAGVHDWEPHDPDPAFVDSLERLSQFGEHGR